MDGGWSVTEVEVFPRSAIARVQMKTAGRNTAPGWKSAEARLDLGKVMFLDALPSSAATDPAAFATVLVGKLGEKGNVEILDAGGFAGKLGEKGNVEIVDTRGFAAKPASGLSRRSASAMVRAKASRRTGG